MSLGTTPSQTVGPYFSIGLTEPWAARRDAVDPGHPDAIELAGTVIDGRGEPVPDAMIETWQADPHGRFDHADDPRGAATYPGFRAFGRSETDGDGRWRINTLKPGRLPAAGGAALQAPHIAIVVFARGLLKPLLTRAYFGDEPAANVTDPVLATLPDDVGATLVAAAVAERGYRFDIHLQGRHETAFFAL